jgi:medium-chain acyl-[acyl-carrier-protein] hydrolase
MNVSPETQRWLVYQNANPLTRMRLFTFPYAGGSASLFSAWSSWLPREVAVCPVQLPGRGSRMREKPFARVDEIVAALVRALEPLLDLPYALFGHSMGALISFELARAVRRRNLPAPHRLFVSAFRAPHLPDPDPPMHAMPEADLIQELTVLNGTPREVLQDRELLAFLLPMVRADAAVCETYAYAPETPLDCPITVFGGITDPKISQAELSAWPQHSRGECKLRMVPGDHFFLHNPAVLLPALAADLEATLTAIRRSVAPGLAPPA